VIESGDHDNGATGAGRKHVRLRGLDQAIVRSMKTTAEGVGFGSFCQERSGAGRLLMVPSGVLTGREPDSGQQSAWI